MVLAGAGSGKTRVITHRIAWMIEQGVAASGILAVTFTNKAAREMRDRVLGLTGQGDVTVATFHSFAARFLRQEFPSIGRGGDFTIYDDADSQVVIKRALAEEDLDPQHHSPQSVRSKISNWKNARQTPEQVLQDADSGSDVSYANLYKRYDTALLEANACDFDDLLFQTLLILERQSEVRDRWQERITHVLVDEYQDTNHVQFDLLHQLCKVNRNLCITGDPDQSIYSWRGADPGNFDRFQEAYPETGVVPLERNYRSTGNILKTASELVSRNRRRIPKTLWTEAEDGEPVRIVAFDTDYEEALAIAKAIEDWEADGYARREIAVFFRTNALSLPVERVFVQAGIPYRMIGGLEFFARQEVKDLIAYLRFLANPRDLVSLLRIINLPTRGIGQKTQEQIIALARRRGTYPGALIREPGPFEGLTARASKAVEGFGRVLAALDRAHEDNDDVEPLLQAVIDETGYGDYWKLKASKSGSLDPYGNIGQLTSLANDFDKHFKTGMVPFLEQISLLTDLDRWDAAEERVSMLTLHSSKGLEFDAVLIVGVEDGLIPHIISAQEADGLEEERRLLHVGMTRARRRLVLTHANTRSRFGRSQAARPSPFLDEIGKDGVEFFGRPTSGPAGPGGFDDDEERWLADEDHPLVWLRKGHRVMHPEWGEGVVLSLRPSWWRAGGLSA